MNGWMVQRQGDLVDYLSYMYIYIPITLNSIKHPQKGTCSLNMGFLETEHQHFVYKPCNFGVPCSMFCQCSFSTFFGQPDTQSPSPNVESHISCNVMDSRKPDFPDFWARSTNTNVAMLSFLATS